MPGTSATNAVVNRSKAGIWLLLILSAVTIISGILIFYWIELATIQSAYFLERPGEIVEETTSSTAKSAAHTTANVTLKSSSGLAVDMRIKRPAKPSAARLPVLLIIGGEGTGKRAVDLADVPDFVAYAAIDYPYSGSRVIRGVGSAVKAIPAVQQAFLDTPPALMLARLWLVQQPWVDPSRVEIVGVSLGVPFAAAAGALDPGFGRVWLIHGGGDNISWINHALKRHIQNDLVRGAVTRALYQLVYGNSFNTSYWVRRTYPRPVVLVAARDDERVPAASTNAMEALISSEHVELVWTEGRHIGPGREAELQQLLDLVVGRIAID